MPSDVNPPQGEETKGPAREPISPAKRKRLQKLFEHGSKQMAQEEYDYASELFAQCVAGDPGNLIYVQSFVGNLQKKYHNNKTGSKLAQLKERGARSGVKKAVAHQKWDEAITHGLKVLAVNPWDVPTLRAMATVAENTGDDEVELLYLKCALDVNPKDPAVNRQCALALAARNEFDNAIACWHRVQQAKPGDFEAPRAISDLAVEKTIYKGRYEEEVESRVGGGQQVAAPQPRHELAPDEKLKRKIADDPTDLSAYHSLAQLYINQEDYQKAEEVYTKAYEVSENDADLCEKLEDMQLRYVRQQITLAEDDQTRGKLRTELIEKELVFYQNQCERYPNNLGFRYDLGLRYHLSGRFNEAIKEFQQGRRDPRHKGVCMLALGKCFEEIKQYRLATSHYRSATDEISNREGKQRKDALYRAGRLALGLKDLDSAEKYLTGLAELDFGYKDVSTLLDKISQLRDNQ